MFAFGGEIRITAVNPFGGLKYLKEELDKLNDQYKFTGHTYLENLCTFKEKSNSSFFFNDILSFEILKDNYDEFYYASDFFEEVVISNKEEKIKKAEITDERILIKIKTNELRDFKFALLVAAAFGNLTDGIVDLIAFGNDVLSFENQFYTSSEWEMEIVRILKNTTA